MQPIHLRAYSPKNSRCYGSLISGFAHYQGISSSIHHSQTSKRPSLNQTHSFISNSIRSNSRSLHFLFQVSASISQSR